MIQKWKRLNRKTLLEHPRMTIIEDEIELPDGTKTTYILHKPGAYSAVTIIAINGKGEFLLQREYSYPPDEVLYQLPGGGVDKGEDIIDAANRELSEESGYVGDDCTYLGSYYSNNRRADSKMHVVVCKDLHRQERPKDVEEYIESEWVSRERLRSLIKTDKIKNVHLLAALQMYDASDQTNS